MVHYLQVGILLDEDKSFHCGWLFSHNRCSKYYEVVLCTGKAARSGAREHLCLGAEGLVSVPQFHSPR